MRILIFFIYWNMSFVVGIMVLMAGLGILATLIAGLACWSAVAWFEFRERSEDRKDEEFFRTRQRPLDEDYDIRKYFAFQPENGKMCNCKENKVGTLPKMLPRMRLPGSPGYDECFTNTPFQFRSEIRQRTIIRNVRRRLQIKNE